MELTDLIVPAFCLAAYVAVAVMSYGPYGLVEHAAGYAGSETPNGDYQARHGTRAMWLMVAAVWPLTFGLASAGYAGRRAAALVTWLRQEV